MVLIASKRGVHIVKQMFTSVSLEILLRYPLLLPPLQKTRLHPAGEEREFGLTQEEDGRARGSGMTSVGPAHLPEGSEGAGRWRGQGLGLRTCSFFLASAPLGSLPL